MPEITFARTKISENRQADYEGYNQAELEKRWRNMVTDQAERLPVPMNHSIHYMYGEGGKLYSEQDELFETILDNALAEAEVAARWDPANWEFERRRRLIEKEELQAVQALSDGEKLITFSPIPDEVREGRADLNGYDRTRQKMLGRITERRGEKVAILYFSLDGSDYASMQAAARSVGAELPEGLNAEQVLANWMYFDTSHNMNTEECYEAMRSSYDETMERQFGEQFYAGRPGGMTMDNALKVVEHPDNRYLLNDHWTEVDRIMALGLDKKRQEKLLEEAKYNLAAALDSRRKGVQVKSLTDAGDSARDDGLDYSGDCATGTSGGSSSAGEIGMAQGRGEKKRVTCPHCREKVITDPCDPECSSCGATAKHGPRRKSSHTQTEHSSLEQESVYDILMHVHEQNRVRAEQKQLEREQRQEEKTRKLGETAVKS